MKLDLLYEIDVPKPWAKPHPYGQREAEQRAYREAIEQIKLADTLGFNCTWHVEHHFREGRSHSPAPEVIIGALSQCTENLRLGFGVTLMPHAFTPPMRVAEKVATADILSNGRVEWGTGRSTPMEQTAFHVPRDESRDQWEEAIRAVVQMWEDEYFEFHGKYLDFPRRMVTPKPVQDPHPPCWMAATSDGSAAVAGQARARVAVVLDPPAPRPDGAAHRAVPRGGREPRPDHARHHEQGGGVHARALRRHDGAVRSERHLGLGVVVVQEPRRVHARVGVPEHSRKSERDKIFPLLKRQIEGNFEAQEFSDADMIIVGDPEHCLQKMLHYADLGVDQLICYVQFGHLEHETIMRTIELLGTRGHPRARAARRRRRRLGERRHDPNRRHPRPRLSGVAAPRRQALRRARCRAGDRAAGVAHARVGRRAARRGRRRSRPRVRHRRRGRRRSASPATRSIVRTSSCSSPTPPRSSAVSTASSTSSGWRATPTSPR